MMNHRKQMAGNRNQDKNRQDQSEEHKARQNSQETAFSGNRQTAGNRQKAFKCKDLEMS